MPLGTEVGLGPGDIVLNSLFKVLSSLLGANYSFGGLSPQTLLVLVPGEI